MKRSASRYGVASLVLFAIALAFFLITGVFFEALVMDLSNTAERLVGWLTLVLPAALGALLALAGLFSDGRRGLALLGLLLNVPFAIFFSFVLLFAG